MMKVLVPRDVEADILQALGGLGVSASTIVPADADQGIVRVSRTGGEIVIDGTHDRPQMLCEVWERDSVSAFDLAVRVYAALMVVRHRGHAVENISITDMKIDPPRALDDPGRPELYRVQFVFSFITDLTILELNNG